MISIDDININNDMLKTHVQYTDELIIYSKFFEHTEQNIVINIFDLSKEFAIMLLIYVIYSNNINLFVIDSIIQGIVFCINFLELKNNLLKNNLFIFDRYIYITLLYCGYYISTFLLWGHFNSVLILLSYFCMCPTIMCKIYIKYKNITNGIYEIFNELIRKIICSYILKIINIVNLHILKISCVVMYDDIVPFYNKCYWSTINKFIISFVVACIFNYLDSGKFKVPLMIYKNIYMKDTKYNIINDKHYLQQIIIDKQWDKLMDVYTLNRIIRICLADKHATGNQISHLLKKMLFKFNRVMFCWTILSISNLTTAIMCFVIFIKNANNKLHYLLNIIAFMYISYFVDQFMVLILCEICFSLCESKIIKKIVYDTYISSKNKVVHIYNNTHNETYIICIILHILLYFDYVKYLCIIFIVNNCKTIRTITQYNIYNFTKHFTLSLLFCSFSLFNQIHIILVPFIVQYLLNIFSI